MALRDIIVSYTAQVDDSEIVEADKKIKRLTDSFTKFAALASTVASAAAYFSYSWVEAASEVEERMNVLTTTFGENSAGVLKWSEDHAKAIGRSRFALQGYAADFGAFLEPKKFDSSTLEEMSTKMAGLAVDLASFYNTTDQEASRSLLSGLSGETESVRRFGIDISDERLSQLNKEYNGQKSIYKFLDLKAKTELRYQAILRDTANKQGDAAKTADSWANSTKRVKDQYNVFAVEIGQRLLPKFKEVLLYVEAGAQKGYELFKKLVFETNTLRDVLVGIGVWMNRSLIAQGVRMALFEAQALLKAFKGVQLAVSIIELQQGAWAALRFAIEMATASVAKFFTATVLPLAGVIAGVLLLQDLFGFFTGDESMRGGIIEELYDVDSGLDAMNGTLSEIARRIISVFQLIANAPSALGYALAGGDFKTKLNEGVIDVDAEQRKQVQSRAEINRLSVERGDKKQAIEFRRKDENRRQAGERFDAERREYLLQNPDKVTAADAQYFGLKESPTALPFDWKPPPPSTKGPMIGPPKPPTSTKTPYRQSGPITINQNIDASKVAFPNLDAFKRALKEGNAELVRQLEAGIGYEVE